MVKTYFVTLEMQLIMPLLVLPIMIVTAGKVFHYGWSRNQLLQVLPLLILVLNSTYIWICIATAWLIIPQDVGISYQEFKNLQVISFAIYLEPLNTFLYTWRFMSSIEHDKAGQ